MQPLISLMMDQIKALDALGVALCKLMPSESTTDTRQQTKEEVLKQVKESSTIVLASPEAVLYTH